MKRAPILLIAGLTAMWLLLNTTLAPGHFLMGLAVSMLMVFGFRAVRPLQPRLRRPQMAFLLLWRVLVGHSAFQRRSGPHRARAAGDGADPLRFLDVRSTCAIRHGLAVLAAIVTSTPGTIWVEPVAGWFGR